MPITCVFVNHVLLITIASAAWDGDAAVQPTLRGLRHGHAAHNWSEARLSVGEWELGARLLGTTGSDVRGACNSGLARSDPRHAPWSLGRLGDDAS